MKTLRFGTAGIPISTPEPNTLNGIRHVKKLSLEAMELEFVRSVNITEEKTTDVKKAARENDVVLTCHGQYYINLNSLEKAKIEASKHRIYKAAKIASMCGAVSMTFHAGFYMKQEEGKVYETIKQNLKEVIDRLKDENHKIWVRPETTGKGSQFGTLSEILKLSTDLENVMPCIDFAHLHARSNGKVNTYKEFADILSEVEKILGREGLNNMHIHMSGIEYTEKGERRHLVLQESDMNYTDLLKALKDFRAKGILIGESPNIEEDALLMKETYNKSI